MNIMSPLSNIDERIDSYEYLKKTFVKIYAMMGARDHQFELPLYTIIRKILNGTASIRETNSKQYVLAVNTPNKSDVHCCVTEELNPALLKYIKTLIERLQ